ncbi:MAG: carbohydrate-binding domain-containing protein, partial [Clostridia bacterium]|nr:carbohydrate-binding domain-containing protein [Clostridia bacterium]
MFKKISGLLLAVLLTAALAACSTAGETEETPATPQAAAQAQTATQAETQSETKAEEKSSDFDAIITTANVTSNGVIDATDLFTERDLTQNADLSQATSYTVKDNENIDITKEGVYVLSGSASNVTVTVEVEDNEKVQIVLDNVSITNSS